MSNCLLCDSEMKQPLTWNVLILNKEENVCKTCRDLLQLLTGETCCICGRVLHDDFREGEMCSDCIRWEQDPEWRGILKRNVSLFHYNEFLKETIAKFKYRGDYAIASAFSFYINAVLQKMEFDLLVPVPLSSERLFERGFNQAEALAKCAGFSCTDILARMHSEKQSKKSRKERMIIAKIFQVKSPDFVVGKNILLLDDIYTTGSTIRNAAKELRLAGVSSVQSFTLAR
ncbi:ComF family protein [Bacillus sp. MUM 13]|uniref:ComF family protein n=1 Tax=Bacillus sp. MUM 13 TaxID=1678001 RepID=UPI0008F5E083|nr:ComF family protein [Bacillus sp. MUM 13]OIK11434.1 amidophosphoribosyltransferase [Bacillus sp. MUM 13]